MRAKRGDLQHRRGYTQYQVADWISEHALGMLRLSLGVIFVWFGVLKFFPTMSPAESLAGDTMRAMTFGLVPDRLALDLLAVLETTIGAGLIFKKAMRCVLVLLFIHLIGTVTSIFFVPSMLFVHFPHVLTLEGQYVVKNAVLASAGVVLFVSTTVRPLPHSTNDSRAIPPGDRTIIKI